MNLCASLIVRNELNRYLEPCLRSLHEFCDTIIVLDDGSDDATMEFLSSARFADLLVVGNTIPQFRENEGKARQKLLEFTLSTDATHVLSLDADEFVEDGAELRRLLTASPETPFWSLCMEEVWKADEAGLQIRFDGGWKPRTVPILWKVPSSIGNEWRILPRKLASGREPIAVAKQRHRATHTEVSILHFGWTNVSERRSRYQRYLDADDGKFHQKAHLDSIVWTDEKVELKSCRWSPGLASVRPELLASVRREREQRPTPI